MPKLQPYAPSSEAELHALIEDDLEAIEEGLEILQHEYPTGRGFVDFLCVDSGGRLVIIEVKLIEDENVLFQALRYFSDVDRVRYRIASTFSGKVNADEQPRIIIIAKRFSEDVKRLSTLVVPEVELLEYSAVILPSEEIAVVYHSVTPPGAIRLPSEPPTIERLVNYLTADGLKPVLDKMRKGIMSVGDGIQEYATQSYIGYRHPCGRQFAYIKVFRRELEIGAHIIDEDRQLVDYEGIRVKTGEEDYSGILEEMRKSYNNLSITCRV